MPGLEAKRSRRRSGRRRGNCTCLRWRRFPNRVTKHGRPAPVVAHGILEVAEQQARPATPRGDSGQLNNASTKFDAGLWTELRSNVRRACMHEPRQSGHGAPRYPLPSLSSQALIAKCKSRSRPLATQFAKRGARQSDSDKARNEDSTNGRCLGRNARKCGGARLNCEIMSNVVNCRVPLIVAVFDG